MGPESAPYQYKSRLRVQTRKVSKTNHIDHMVGKGPWIQNSFKARALPQPVIWPNASEAHQALWEGLTAEARQWLLKLLSGLLRNSLMLFQTNSPLANLR